MALTSNLANKRDGFESVIRIHPFNIRIETDIDHVVDGLQHLYKDYQWLPLDSFCDYNARVIRSRGIRGVLRKQAFFYYDVISPFKPLPIAQAYPFFEWGLNWCISFHSHQYLVFHAAVVEKHGKTLILPGEPGSGKSTLCAALINMGWRLLSDELTLVDCISGNIVPTPRPVSLKNESIDLIAETFPDNQFSPIVHDTLKGSVALMRPPTSAIIRAEESALPSLVVFPKYLKNQSLLLSPITKAEAFMRLADMSFNYSLLRDEGFQILVNMIKRCQAYDFVYDGDFEQAADCFDKLLG